MGSCPPAEEEIKRGTLGGYLLSYIPFAQRIVLQIFERLPKAWELKRESGLDEPLGRDAAAFDD